MNSMTGYGKGIAEKDGRNIIIELKSVNHRFLDITAKMPRNFMFADDTVKKSINNAFSRGHIDIYFNIEDNREIKRDIEINYELAEQYFRASEKLSEKLNIENDFTAAKLMRINDVVTVKETEENEEELLLLIEKATAEAIGSLKEMRKSEGERLAFDIKEKLKYIEEKLIKVKVFAPSVKVSYAEKLKSRIKEALDGVEIDEARLLNEVAFFADKSCIDEEIIRLGSHLNEARKYFTQNEPVGKKFDFLVQEMNREINTMGSKSNDTTLTGLVLDMKNELEKIREQVQNIE